MLNASGRFVVRRSSEPEHNKSLHIADMFNSPEDKKFNELRTTEPSRSGGSFDPLQFHRTQLSL
jgi:hypothetical protein